jgi:hypothetical protein
VGQEVNVGLPGPAAECSGGTNWHANPAERPYPCEVPEYRRAVVAWSAGISAAAVAFAAVIASRAETALSSSPLFILCVVVGVVAGAILLVAGIPDFAGWLRGTGREEPAYWATVREIRQRAGALNGRRQDLAGIAGFATGTGKYRWLAGEVWAGKTTLLA